MNLQKKLTATLIITLMCLFVVPIQFGSVQAGTKVSMNKKEKEKDNSCLTDFLKMLETKERADEKNSLIGNYKYLLGFRWIDNNKDGIKELFISEVNDSKVKIIVLTAKNGKVVKAGEMNAMFYAYNPKMKSMIAQYINTAEDGTPQKYEVQSYYLRNRKLYRLKTACIKTDYRKYYRNNINITKGEFEECYNKYYKNSDVAKYKFIKFERVNKENLALMEGESGQLDVLGSSKETWLSTDESIATVNGQGVVTAIVPGVVIIKAKTPTKEYSINVQVISKGAKNAPILSKDVFLNGYDFVLPKEWETSVKKYNNLINTLPQSELDKATKIPIDKATNTVYAYAVSNALIQTYDNTENKMDLEELKKTISIMYTDESLKNMIVPRTKGVDVTNKTEKEVDINNHKFYQLSYQLNYKKLDGTAASGTINIYGALYGESYLIIREYDFGNGTEFKSAMDYLLNTIQYNKK